MESITKTVILEQYSDATVDPPVVHPSEVIKFKRLDLEELINIGDQMVATREAIAKDLAKENKLDTHEIINVILDIRSRRPSITEILNYARCPEGALLLLQKSLMKNKISQPEIKRINSRIPTPEAIELAKDLVLDIQQVPSKAEVEKEKDASPLLVGESSGISGTAPVQDSPKLNIAALESTLREEARGYGSHLK